MFNYEYADTENGISQYDDINLKEQNIVDAVYVKSLISEDRGNPYIEALPPLRSISEMKIAYRKSIPGYSFEKTLRMSNTEKMFETSLLRDLRFVLPFHRDLEQEVNNAMVFSYRHRYRVVSKGKDIGISIGNEKAASNSILAGSSADSTNAGLSLIGYSGCGKSSAISILVSYYPKVIIHSDGKGGHFPQIPYLVVNCMPNSNFGALYQGIADEIDRALGNIEPVYSREIRRYRSLGEKTNYIISLIERFAVGIIIFDEIQLIDFSHTKENTFDSLLTIANRTKVAIAVVGTEDAKAKMFPELRTGRRVGKMITGNDYCIHKDFFDTMVNNVFQYQWFDKLFEVTDDIRDTLFDVTKGIVDQLISVYTAMNIEYIRTPKAKRPKVIDGDFIRCVVKKYYPGMELLLENLETSEGQKAYADKKKEFEKNIDEILDAERQREQIPILVNNASQEADMDTLVSNIVRSVSAITDDYSEQEIERISRKIVSRNIDKGYTEKQLAAKVYGKLTEAPKPKRKKSKVIVPDEIEMRNFLENGDDDGLDTNC